MPHNKPSPAGPTCPRKSRWDWPPAELQHTILEGCFGVVLPDGFENHAGMVGLGMSLHFEFFINSWCHSWAMPPPKAERQQQKLREDGRKARSVSSEAKSKALASREVAAGSVAGLATLGDDGEELDSIGRKNMEVARDLCANLDPIAGEGHVARELSRDSHAFAEDRDVADAGNPLQLVDDAQRREVA